MSYQVIRDGEIKFEGTMRECNKYLHRGLRDTSLTAGPYTLRKVMPQFMVYDSFDNDRLVFIGTMKECEKFLGVEAKIIYNYIKNGYKIQRRYTVARERDL